MTDREQHRQQVDRVIDALIDNTHLSTQMHTNAEFRAAVELLAGVLPRFVELLAEEADERAKQYSLMAEAIRRGRTDEYRDSALAVLDRRCGSPADGTAGTSRCRDNETDTGHDHE